MKSTLIKQMTAYLVAACMAAQPAFAAVIDISNVPLGSTAGSGFLPNLLFTLDNSGSMAWDFLPDYVNPATSGMTSNPCMTDGDGFTSNGTTNCVAGDPPYTAGGAFGSNGVAYDPNFSYLAGLDSKRRLSRRGHHERDHEHPRPALLQLDRGLQAQRPGRYHRESGLRHRRRRQRSYGGPVSLPHHQVEREHDDLRPAGDDAHRKFHPGHHYGDGGHHHTARSHHR